MQLSSLITALQNAPVTRPLVPEGEQELQISSIVLKLSKKDKPMIEVMLTSITDADCAAIFHYLLIPEESEKKSYQIRMIDMKRFTIAFDIPLEDLTLLEGSDQQAIESAFVGKKGWAIIKHEAADGEYEASAKVKKWQIAESANFDSTVVEDIPF